MTVQPSLFGDEPPRAPTTARAVDSAIQRRLATCYDEAASLAARVPPNVHFGTSSWSFPGWAGLVYGARRSATALAREGLREYAAHPLLTTVGIDRSYYAPMPVDDLRRYADQLPDGFRCCLKAPASVTAYAAMADGPGAPALNPDFLSAHRLVDELLKPCAVAFAAHTGPIIFECPPVPRGVRLDPADFASRLDMCLAALPRTFTYAVELRDRRLLTPSYASVLARHGVAHTYNYWSAMPLPGEQAVVVPPESLTGDVVVIRLLLRPGTRYAEQRDAFRPFDRLVQPDPGMRADVVAVARRALRVGKRVYVLVNNKAEGSSPLTVMALARQMGET